MFEELEKLIRLDKETHKSFERIKDKFMNNQKSFATKLVSRTRRQAIFLATASVLIITAILYSYNLKANFDASVSGYEHQIKLLNLELDKCRATVTE